MITCSRVGCRCEGTRDDHRQLKAYEGGFIYYAASYWHRFNEPSGVYVSLVPGKAESAAEKGAKDEEEECRSLCDNEECEGTCELCEVDVCTGGEFTYKVRDLFSPAELKEHRRELLRGEVVYLPR